MSNVNINIAAEFKGKKAFKEAQSSTDKLTKNVKGLAKSLLAVYSAQKLYSFSKAAVKAFAEDEKAAASLGTTLKNLGLAYGSNVGTVNGFISRLEMQTGVLDDELRPAMDRLLRATGDVTKSQELLGLALDISAGTGKSLTQVSQSLQKAYLGQTQALGRLGVGLTKAELTSSSFEEIQARLATLFAGQAATAANTYAGSLAKLTVAGNNAKETIGEGLVDALKTASGSDTIDPLIKGIDRIANAIAGLARETGKFIAITKSIFDFDLFAKNLDAFKGMGNISVTVSSQDTQKADAIAKKNQAQLTKLTKEQAAAQAKIVKDKKLGAAIDKANLALNKGTDIFDMDKIQIAAALANQTEQLGKATNTAQVLQIANDTARLNVKRSILALEDAIASKDEVAITNATAKLNEDLKILGALTGQKTQMAAIESILKSLVPKDLINQKNLDEALNKIKEMLALLAGAKFPTAPIGGGGGGGGGGTPPVAPVAPVAPVIPPSGNGGLLGGKTAEQLAADAALKKFFEEQLAKEAAAKAASAAAAKAAADALAQVGKGITEIGIVGETIDKIAKEDATVANIDAILEYADAAQARANAIADLLDLSNKVDMEVLTANALANRNLALQAFQQDESQYLLPSANGSIGGGIGAFDRDITITVNTGVGDPNAIAEAIQQILLEANARGTITNGILGLG